MKVNQLIEKLQKLDKELVVYVVDHNVDGCGHDELLEVSKVTCKVEMVPAGLYLMESDQAVVIR